LIPDVSWVFSTVAGPAGKTKRVTIRDIHNGRIFWKVDLRNALSYKVRKQQENNVVEMDYIFKGLNHKLNQ
jgi:hypothetical protein